MTHGPVNAQGPRKHRWRGCELFSPLQTAAEAVKADLMNRLNNAVKQRDAAREETLAAQTQLSKLQEDIETGALTPAPRPGKQ